MGRHIAADPEHVRPDVARGVMTDSQNGRHPMSPELRAAFEALKNDVIWLHAKWTLYRQLFADDVPGRLATLNEAAGFSFYAIQDVFWQDVVLHLARLLDREMTCGQQNLCLAALPALVDERCA